MRFTQFGHHVPLKNSTTRIARRKNPDMVNIPSRLAASSANSGAREPTCSVSVRSRIFIDFKAAKNSEQ
jgi:hypothetical protein